MVAWLRSSHSSGAWTLRTFQRWHDDRRGFHWFLVLKTRIPVSVYIFCRKYLPKPDPGRILPQSCRGYGKSAPCLSAQHLDIWETRNGWKKISSWTPGGHPANITGTFCGTFTYPIVMISLVMPIDICWYVSFNLQSLTLMTIVA